MKLPIILSAMIAALAIPGSLASEATDETKTEAAPEAAPEAAATPEATPEATPAAPTVTDEHHGKHTAMKGSSHHAKGKHHHKRHYHHEGKEDVGTPPPVGSPYREAYDGAHLQGADGYPKEDRSRQAGNPVAPGHQTP